MGPPFTSALNEVENRLVLKFRRNLFPEDPIGIEFKIHGILIYDDAECEFEGFDVIMKNP